jgi:hypothetical protein
MKKSEPLALRCVIPIAGSPITFAAGEEEAGVLKRRFYATGEEIERLLALRCRELIVVLTVDS